LFCGREGSGREDRERTKGGTGITPLPAISASATADWRDREREVDRETSAWTSFLERHVDISYYFERADVDNFPRVLHVKDT